MCVNTHSRSALSCPYLSDGGFAGRSNIVGCWQHIFRLWRSDRSRQRNTAGRWIGLRRALRRMAPFSALLAMGDDRNVDVWQTPL
jgi:hypothetical protein